MCKKGIDLRRVNEHCANEEIKKVLQERGIEGAEGQICLVKIALRYRPASRERVEFKKAANNPFYAFYKPVGKKKAAIYKIATGEVKIVSVASISKVDEVKGKFTIGGVTYGPKDTVNGLRRFGQYK